MSGTLDHDFRSGGARAARPFEAMQANDSCNVKMATYSQTKVHNKPMPDADHDMALDAARRVAEVVRRQPGIALFISFCVGGIGAWLVSKRG